ncbi:MAG: hypothetical protein K940chlam3_01407, partial [Chlamydiae bacterium]|nr:hypothetical protein [Chlamydiota bacterium]
APAPAPAPAPARSYVIQAAGVIGTIALALFAVSENLEFTDLI